VSDGQLRASFERIVPEDGISTAAFDVQPALPWHGFRRSDRNPNVFAAGRIARLKFDLMPTAWVFARGHRIRIAIAGADSPTFELHPLLAGAKQAGLPPPMFDIHRGSNEGSYVELPIVPAK